VGEYSRPAVEGDGLKEIKEPILFLAGATVELAVSATASGTGGVRVWVINAESSAEYERSGKITVQLNTGDKLPMGM
jgi:hypothetical protein